ncbi:molybdenum cofactor biosynthesis protein MoaB [Litorilinea aerophila]|uniref:Molybdenum cofactor biosynthesis protein B n=1 Tax=Litorilinea aerophila TaxID=1204385 RepID=A0A540VJ52_9CHLR|nr:molybdenum cofactor biosynthesis protein B [Litorilinea aerophila]MCC9076188.1 molybdenum cofactor biosynthesis protein MoaB [Litorilinea aerophila]GIV78888.1 MAG: molybdenum cofactor biosynthesis protein B [Litorilinea sp.]
MGVNVHRQQAESQGSVPIAIVTVSDTRTPETDVSGRLIRELAEAAGHVVVDYRIVRDEPDQVEQALDDFAAGLARVIIFNGGTGISRRDRTFDVLSRRLEKTLPGFGELFRMLSYQEVGAAAMLSRATAGVYRDRIVVSTPGSPNAVRLAMEKLLLPEIQHLAWELVRT